MGINAEISFIIVVSMEYFLIFLFLSVAITSIIHRHHQTWKGNERLGKC
jgi:hypothetical protein